MIIAPLVMGFFYAFVRRHSTYELGQNHLSNRRTSPAFNRRAMLGGVVSGLTLIRAYPTSEPLSHHIQPIPNTPLAPEVHPTRSQPAGVRPTPYPDALKAFIQSITNGQSEIITGLYAKGVLELQVVQQPDGEAGFVSYDADTVTLFQSALPFGVTGLLAHNFLSGKNFFSLKSGQEVDVIYGDGSIQAYRIDQIADFQRLAELDPSSDFQDLQSGDRVTSSEVFNRFYKGLPHLTLQTCLEKDGDLNWGVRFIVAQPINANP